MSLAELGLPVKGVLNELGEVIEKITLYYTFRMLGFKYNVC